MGTILINHVQSAAGADNTVTLCTLFTPFVPKSNNATSKVNGNDFRFHTRTNDRYSSISNSNSNENHSDGTIDKMQNALGPCNRMTPTYKQKNKK